MSAAHMKRKIRTGVMELFAILAFIGVQMSSGDDVCTRIIQELREAFMGSKFNRGQDTEPKRRAELFRKPSRV